MDAPAHKNSAPKFGTASLSGIEALKAGRGSDNTVGLFMTREELEGRGTGPMAAFMKDYASTIKQPIYSIDKDAKGAFPRTGEYNSGMDGVADLLKGFGEKTTVRKLYFDVDALEAKFSSSRKSNKEKMLDEVVKTHDSREDSRVERSKATMKANREAKKEQQGQER